MASPGWGGGGEELARHRPHEVALDLGVPDGGTGGGGDTTAFLLFPFFPDGTLVDEADRLWRGGEARGPEGASSQRMTTGQVLGIFIQVGV